MNQNKDIVRVSDATLVSAPSLSEAATDYAQASRASNTKRAYAADWQHFTTWCNEHGSGSLPATAQTVANYIAALAKDGYKSATITRRLASISQAHQFAGFGSPTKLEGVRSVLKGIRRTHTTAQDQAAPITIEVLRLLVGALPITLMGQRDRALLLVGFAGALRRSELVALQVADVQFVSAGMILTLRRSKTDQEGAGASKGIAYGENKYTCPVRALKAWLKDAGITHGPIFRPLDRWGNVETGQLSDRAVARVVQRTVAAAGLDPKDYSGHSLRAGLVTSAALAGASETEIMRQSGHKSSQMVQKYIRVADVFKENISGKVGL